MKRLATLLFLLVPFFHLTAQHETDIWYFGSSAGLDFNSGSPVSLTDGMTSTTEGTSCISDTGGNLLFYTDGITVWNKQQNQMSNGYGLNGGYSSTQSALILNEPGSDSLYYIFTTSEGGGAAGLQYSVVDMSLQSGDGEVILKNIPLQAYTAEKVTGAKQANGTDYWVLSHNSVNTFYAYKLSETGVDATPVVTTIGTNNNDVIGYLKVSHNGQKVALASEYGGFAELFDFDNSTGIISNPIYLNLAPTSFGAYGIEFSPSDSILYASGYSPSYLMQWDISSGDAATINASRTDFTSIDAFVGALQLASDGKIYLAKYFGSYLGVINDPNVLGTGCNFVDQGYLVTWGSCQLGLPNAFPAFFSQNPSPVSQFSAIDATLCQKFCTDYSDQSANNPTSWQWIFEGGSPPTSSDQNPTSICYNSPGSYDVTLITSNQYGTDTLVMDNFITVYATPPFPSITQDGYALISSAAAFYQWQLNAEDIPGATQQSYTVTQSGEYTVIVTDSNGCKNSSSIVITISGMEQIADDNLVITPNPSSGHFSIEWINVPVSENLSVEIIDPLGQEIYSTQETISSTKWQKEIELNNISHGVYLIRLKTHNYFLERKLLMVN